MCIKKTLAIGFCAYVTVFLGGCAVVAEKTNFLSDNDIKSKVAGTLGYSPNDITLISRRTEGTDTYAVVSAKNNKQFACTLNGGNLLTAGIVNPPNCVAKN